MRVRFDDQNIRFTIGNLNIYASNIVYECLEQPIPKHSHSKNSYEIHYVPYGSGLVTADGVSYPVTPNTLFVTGPFVAHEQLSEKSDPMYEYCIYLKLEKNGAPESAGEDMLLIRAFEKINFWIGQDRQELHPLLMQLFYELEHHLPGRKILADILCKQIFVQVIRNYVYKKEAELFSPEVSSGYCSPADNNYLMIEECFLYEYRYLTLEKLSRRLGLGARQVERLLKAQYGMTFLQKKNEARMSAATVMLADKSRKITDISEAVGYSCVEHFSAAFKKYYRISASQYRRERLSPDETVDKAPP